MPLLQVKVITDAALASMDLSVCVCVFPFLGGAGEGEGMTRFFCWGMCKVALEE